MKKELFEDITERIEDLYANLFLIAIDKGYNLRSIVNEVSGKVDKYCDSKAGTFIPRGFDGVVFVSSVAKSIGASTTDALYMSEVEKKLIIYKLIEKIDPQSIMVSDYDFDEDEDITTIDYLYLFQDNYGADAFFKFTFIKALIEDDGYKYSVEVTLTKDGASFGVDTDLMYDSAIIWSEETGKLEEFMEAVIETIIDAGTSMEAEEDLEEDDDEELIPESDTDSEEETSNIDKEERIIVGHKKAEVIDEKTGKRIIDELVTYISNDTRSVSLLDRFEGYGDGQPAYRRIVVKNTSYAWFLGLKNEAGLNLVIERSRSRDYVGDITFTEFKQDKDHNLREFLKQEINDEIAEKYLDKDEFYRFSKPYRLRAQNSSNRTGYGWEWDWSGGYGDYTEGTLYGETTDYVFVGAYISSRWSSYDPEHRKPFVNNQSVVTTQKNNSIRIIPYEGKLSAYTNEDILQRFIKVLTPKGKQKYLPVSYDELNGNVYITTANYEKYKDQLREKVSLVKTIID